MVTALLAYCLALVQPKPCYHVLTGPGAKVLHINRVVNYLLEIPGCVFVVTECFSLAAEVTNAMFLYFPFGNLLGFATSKKIMNAQNYIPVFTRLSVATGVSDLRLSNTSELKVMVNVTECGSSSTIFGSGSGLGRLVK